MLLYPVLSVGFKIKKCLTLSDIKMYDLTCSKGYYITNRKLFKKFYIGNLFLHIVTFWE